MRLVDNVEISKCVENVYKVIVLRLTLARIMSLTVTKDSSNQPLLQDKPRSVNLTRSRSNTVTQCLLTRNGFSLKWVYERWRAVPFSLHKCTAHSLFKHTLVVLLYGKQQPQKATHGVLERITLNRTLDTADASHYSCCVRVR